MPHGTTSRSDSVTTFPAGSPPKSALLPRLLLVSGSIAVALVLAEIIARLVGVPPQFGRVMETGQTTHVANGVVVWEEPNPRATRVDIERAAAHADAFTIAGFGDSIMYGVGLAKEQTYLEGVREHLAGRARRPIEVLNLAVKGYNTRQENAVYQKLADTVRPDVVIVHYWGDDGRQYRMVGGYVVDFADMGSDGQVLVRALPLPDAISDYLLVHSSVYELLTHAALTFKRHAVKNDWDQVTQPLTAMAKRVHDSGGRLLVLASADLNGPTPRPVWELAKLQGFAAGNGIDLIDVSQWFVDRPSQDVALDGCHFNAEGHRIIAGNLADYISQHYLPHELERP